MEKTYTTQSTLADQRFPMVFTHNDFMWIVTSWTVDGKETRSFIY